MIDLEVKKKKKWMGKEEEKCNFWDWIGDDVGFYVFLLVVVVFWKGV